MGQSFNKSKSGGEEGKKKDEIVKKYYEKHFKDKKSCSPSEFYRAICDAVKEVNQEYGYTQVEAIDEKTLRDEYQKCRGPKPTEEEFRKIMDVYEKNLKLTGFGVKDTLLYIFGVPASATFIKNAVMPGIVSNEVLIPSVTSLTVLLLAKFNKI